MADGNAGPGTKQVPEAHILFTQEKVKGVGGINLEVRAMATVSPQSAHPGRAEMTLLQYEPNGTCHELLTTANFDASPQMLQRTTVLLRPDWWVEIVLVVKTADGSIAVAKQRVTITSG